MDPIKIVVTNSDSTYLMPSHSNYEQSQSKSESGDLVQSTNAHNAPNNNIVKTKTNRRKADLPPLKLSTRDSKNAYNDHNHVDRYGDDESQTLLHDPMLNKTLPPSQSTTSLYSAKRVKISQLAPPFETSGSGKYSYTFVSNNICSRV